MRRTAHVLVLVAILLVALAPPASACAVCYGESDSAITRGADLSILFMAILTYTLIVGGIVLFFVQMSRARRSAEPSSRARKGQRGGVGPSSSIETSPAG